MVQIDAHVSQLRFEIVLLVQDFLYLFCLLFLDDSLFYFFFLSNKIASKIKLFFRNCIRAPISICTHNFLLILMFLFFFWIFII